MRKLSILFLVCGLVLMFSFFDVSITGAVISGANKMHNSFSLILGLTFLITSFVLFIQSKSLEAIVIPTGPGDADKNRTKRAMEEYLQSKEETPYVLVTGEFQRDNKGKINKDSHQYQIYEDLRKEYGLKPSDMIIENKSQDTLENFLYSVKKLNKKDINKMEIATNKTQYWRFKMFEKEAKQEGLIDEDFEIKPLYTKETPKEFVYGVLALAKDYIRIKSVDSLEEANNKTNNKVNDSLKKKFE